MQLKIRKKGIQLINKDFYVMCVSCLNGKRQSVVTKLCILRPKGGSGSHFHVISHKKILHLLFISSGLDLSHI